MSRFVVFLLCILFAGLVLVRMQNNAPPENKTLEKPKKQDAPRPLVPEVRLEKSLEDTLKDRQKAEQIIDFCNRAEQNTAEDWFTQADRLAFFVRIYLGEWQLPKYNKALTEKKVFLEKLLPPDDLFEVSEKKALRDALLAMHAALATMHANYRELERYVRDPSIQDDGVLGKRLSRKITEAYAQFGLAKKDYFALLEKKAVPAENIFLVDNPLKRQILEARILFSLLRAISFELSKDTVDLAKTRALEEEVRTHIAEAERPPFKGKPLSERRYRAFLKEIKIYADDLAQGNQEGFYPHVRKALNLDLANIRTAYNDFAKNVNDQ
ncbi:MAG: hypothetical protein IJU76_06445 [Desulfovibrionaceae bacterium]|nr:hypothetical protein [Desulfovibrionaceae bacterium]